MMLRNRRNICDYIVKAKTVGWYLKKKKTKRNEKIEENGDGIFCYYRKNSKKETLHEISCHYKDSMLYYAGPTFLHGPVINRPKAQAQKRTILRRRLTAPASCNPIC